MEIVRDRMQVNHHIVECYPKIVARCWKELGRKDAALDCAQETVLEALQSLNTFEYRSKLSTWLYTITTRVLIRHKKQMLFERTRAVRFGNESGYGFAAVESFENDCATPEEEAEFRRNRQILWRLIVKLPLRQRQAVRLHYFAGMPITQIAERMDCSPGTVKSHLHRARGNLCAQFMIQIEPEHNEATAKAV